MLDVHEGIINELEAIQQMVIHDRRDKERGKRAARGVLQKLLGRLRKFRYQI